MEASLSRTARVTPAALPMLNVVRRRLDDGEGHGAVSACPVVTLAVAIRLVPNFRDHKLLAR
jgi:hypothetical protein